MSAPGRKSRSACAARKSNAAGARSTNRPSSGPASKPKRASRSKPRCAPGVNPRSARAARKKSDPVARKSCASKRRNVKPSSVRCGSRRRTRDAKLSTGSARSRSAGKRRSAPVAKPRRKRSAPRKRAKEEEKRIRAEEKAQAKAAKKARKPARAKKGRAEEKESSNEAALSARELWAKRRPGGLAKQFAVMLLLTLVVAVAALPLMPLESAQYEKVAQAWLGQPVKIGTVNLTLLPLPQLKLEKVVIGKEHPMRAAVIKATPVVTSLLGDRISLKSLELEGATFPREFLSALLQNKGRRVSFGVQRIVAKGLKIDIPELNLPALEVDARFSADGALQAVAISNAERKLSVKLQPQGERAAIEISADAFPFPIGVDPGLSEFLAKGTVTRGELALSEAEARAFGGRLLGTVRLRWASGWSMEGELTVRQMEAGKIAAPLLAGGTLQGKGVYSMKGLLPERLILNAQLEAISR